MSVSVCVCLFVRILACPFGVLFGPFCACVCVPQFFGLWLRGCAKSFHHVCVWCSQKRQVCVCAFLCVCVVVVVHRCQIFSQTVLQSAVSLSLSSHVPLLNNAVGGDGHSYIIISLWSPANHYSPRDHLLSFSYPVVHMRWLNLWLSSGTWGSSLGFSHADVCVCASGAASWFGFREAKGTARASVIIFIAGVTHSQVNARIREPWIPWRWCLSTPIRPLPGLGCYSHTC